MNKKVKLFCPCAERYKIQKDQNFKLLRIIKLNLLYNSQVQTKIFVSSIRGKIRSPWHAFIVFINPACSFSKWD